MFYQVPNFPGREKNYLETSGSCMIAYAILKGVRLKALPERYLQIGLDIFNGICNKYLTVKEDGDLNLGGICLVAGLGPENNLRRDGTYEYYIGPNLQTSLVGTIGNNKYQLYDKNKNVEFTRASADVNAVGVSYWWLPSLMTCKRECAGKSGDDLLMCAENFCDNAIGYDERANTQKLKAYCITSTCGYTYTPVSCETANPYASYLNRTNNQDSSTCGITADGKSTVDSKKVNVTCVDDSENDVFDQKRYINIACKEETGIGFTNLIGKKIVATDLRAGAAMVAAGLKAEGKTTITSVEHILRGYEQIVEKLTGVGAIITIKEI